MLVHFPNSTVEVGESRGLTGLDRNTLQSKLKLFVFSLLPKKQNQCFLLKLGIHKKVKQSKTLRQCLSLYKTQCKINLTFQSQKPPNFC